MGITANGLIHLGFIPEVDFSLEDKADGKGAYVARWFSLDSQPTVAEIEVADIEWQSVYDSQEYARKRKAAYDLLNQDELRFDDLENGTTVWQDTINEIKARHPK
jgi:hypothetical protein